MRGRISHGGSIVTGDAQRKNAGTAARSVPRLCAFILATFSFFLASRPSYAQRLPFFNLSIEQGLVQSQATCLAQDTWGRLWIGTLGGLSCYDGTTFTNFSARDGLPSGTITCLAAHPDGSVWIGTARGLVRYEQQRFRPVALPAMPARLAIEKSGTVWCLAGGRVHRVSSRKGQHIPAFSGAVTAILADKEDGLWVAVRGDRLARFRQGKRDLDVLLQQADNGTAIGVANLFQQKNGGILVLNRLGVFSPHSRKGFLRIGAGNDSFPNLAVTCAAEASDGSLWFGTRSGVLHVTDSGIRHLRRHHGLSDNLFYHALTDAEGHVWLASDGQGLFRFSGASFETLDEGAGLPAEQVVSIAADTGGTLYFGTYDGDCFLSKRAASPRCHFLMAMFLLLQHLPHRVMERSGLAHVLQDCGDEKAASLRSRLGKDKHLRRQLQPSIHIPTQATFWLASLMAQACFAMAATSHCPPPPPPGFSGIKRR
jgi:ligand-binding sensor domain-containing protein